MTHQEAINLAKAYARECSVDPNTLVGGEAREAVVVCFTGDNKSRVEVVLDAETGGLIGATVTPGDGSNQESSAPPQPR